MSVQLAKYDIVKEVWDHLKCLYAQSNFAKQYQLKSDIRALKQNNMTIQEFYSSMTNLWDQLAIIESAKLKVVKAYTDQREEQCLVQFLMVLRDDFEDLRGGILHHNPLPNVDSVFNELLVEETRLKTRSNLISNKGVLSTPQSVFTAPFYKGKPQRRVEFVSKINFKSPSSNVVAAFTTIGSGSNHVYPYETTQIYDIVEQLQKLLATQSCAMFASSVKGIGSIFTPNLSFSNVYYIPNLTLSLASVSQFSKLTHIDPFGHNDNVYSDCDFENFITDTTTTPEADIPLVPTTFQEPPVVVDPPPPRYPSHGHKSTQLPSFVYLTYSASFASFLTSIHNLSEPSSYKEAILNPLWQQTVT
ncbi:unnamed protein product [Vicia faba]|uniref:Retrotransposon gag domain-containing protein n=1 Tax=Vicia faba TaxID=3906 RepID=A0AAV0YY18_VICFA|nr:unnamed protein product [Vicia faba]